MQFRSSAVSAMDMSGFEESRRAFCSYEFSTYPSKMPRSSLRCLFFQSEMSISDSTFNRQFVLQPSLNKVNFTALT
ncbi:hypothetical protein FGO68_gene15837 [Halteria grandinella]|uniref:Uncharacterized protein n=1 Tax=Halteria grandinella TaxID=5974 RepID=A0A8J8NH39_HALGN|nr:hypothetical protein FGO68_gene15837 [Halteria grandinella]